MAISDDDALLARIIKNVSNVTVIMAPHAMDRYEKMMMDFRALLGASGIIQHASHGWSSYSSVAAMSRGIPLLNTWIGPGENRDAMYLGTLAGFARTGGCPPELRSANRPEEIIRFWKDVGKVDVSGVSDITG